MADVTLTAGIRSNLLQLQQTSKLFDTTTSRLASGKKVNSAIDNPTNFFAAVNLNDRAEGLSARLDGMGQAVQSIQAADAGITSVRSILSAMKGLVNSALGNTDSDARVTLGNQFNELINQIDTTSADSGYAGINLIQDDGDSGETQTVQFNETFDDSTLDVEGFNIQGQNSVDNTGIAAGDLGTDITAVSVAGVAGDQAASLVIASKDDEIAIGIQGYDEAGMATTASGASATVNWAGDGYKDLLANVISQIENFDTELKNQASSLATNLATITTREEFTNDMINTLSEGADKLTLADLNEEGANLLALQTSNQLATQSLSLASQQSQSVLQLLG